MEIINKLTQQIIKIFKEEFKVELNLKDVHFENPADIKNGHISTNVILKNNSKIGKDPLVAAEILVNKLKEAQYTELGAIEFIKPGFVNFFLSDLYFYITLKEMADPQYLIFPKIDYTINVEYVSANPTGTLHLGHARNASYGDSLANLLKKIGYNVCKEYYINDAGVQMNNLGESVKAFYLEFIGEKLNFPEDGYRGPEIKKIAKDMYENFGDSKINEKLDFFIDYGYKKNMDEIVKLMDILNIKFDYYSSEKFYHDSNKVENVLKELEKKGNIYIEDGAKWLRTTKYGDDKDRVLEKSDHTHTYLTSDIAYHKDKFDRGANHLIDILGGDHHGYIARVKASLQSLGYDQNKVEILLLQMVSVVANNEKVKMSKRKGTAVTIYDLLKEIPPEVIRYFFVMRSPSTQLDFDINLAREQNSENPIFYIQYAHARITRLVEKFEEKNENKNLEIIYKNKLSEPDKTLINKLSQYKEVLEEAARQRKPHIVANFVYELATNYHRYYNQERIFQEDEEILVNKITISKIVKKEIKDALNILGIKAQEKM